MGETTEFLDEVQRLTIEAFADTIVPGVRRFPEDRAIAGVCEEAGAVEAGALELLADPATGITAGVPNLADMLSEHATAKAERDGVELAADVPPFVALDYDARAELVAELTAPGHPEKDGWVLLALFSTMAFDIAAHRHTGEAIAEGHPGLLQMGFAEPDSDGLWRFPEFSYRSTMADPHPGTTASGSPA